MSGYIVYGGFSNFNYVGRLSFPIFAFQISEGYRNTKNLKKYVIRLFLFALISQYPFYLFNTIFTENPTNLNIFFTLLLGLFSIISYDNLKKAIHPIIGIFSVISIGVLAQYINVDYGAFGIAIIFIFHLFKDKKLLTVLGFLSTLLIFYGHRVITFTIENGFYIKYLNIQGMLALCVFLSIIPILLYNKNQGKNIKYFMYIFYPAHLFILYLIYFKFL